MLVSIPDEANVNGRWTFKYYKNGPISAKQFATMGTFFEYGNPIEISENIIGYIDLLTGSFSLFFSCNSPFTTSKSRLSALTTRPKLVLKSNV